MPPVAEGACHRRQSHEGGSSSSGPSFISASMQGEVTPREAGRSSGSGPHSSGHSRGSGPASKHSDRKADAESVSPLLWKYFWAWDRTCSFVLEPTTSVTFVQFVPKSSRPRRKRVCSSCVQLPSPSISSDGVVTRKRRRSAAASARSSTSKTDSYGFADVEIYSLPQAAHDVKDLALEGGLLAMSARRPRTSEDGAGCVGKSFPTAMSLLCIIYAAIRAPHGGSPILSFMSDPANHQPKHPSL